MEGLPDQAVVGLAVVHLVDNQHNLESHYLVEKLEDNLVDRLDLEEGKDQDNQFDIADYPLVVAEEASNCLHIEIEAVFHMDWAGLLVELDLQ